VTLWTGTYPTTTGFCDASVAVLQGPNGRNVMRGWLRAIHYAVKRQPVWAGAIRRVLGAVGGSFQEDKAVMAAVAVWKRLGVLPLAPWGACPHSFFLYERDVQAVEDSVKGVRTACEDAHPDSADTYEFGDPRTCSVCGGTLRVAVVSGYRWSGWQYVDGTKSPEGLHAVHHACSSNSSDDE